jgi:copper oxidase (laccase) domain-containing protein
MKLLGANINNINCSIGPCIGQSSYDVKSDFFKIFVDKSTRNRQFFIEINKDKYQFSLKKFITFKLEEQGVGNIDTVNIDTYKDEHLCFSYRRSLHKKEDDYGRMISTITIKGDHS